jgi:hypothetical protein
MCLIGGIRISFLGVSATSFPVWRTRWVKVPTWG